MFSVRFDQEESFYFGNQPPQPGTQVVSDSSQQDAKQRDSHQRVEDAEQLPPFRLRGGVSKTWRQTTSKESFLIKKKKRPKKKTPQGLTHQ